MLWNWPKLWKLDFPTFSTIFPKYFRTMDCPIFPVCCYRCFYVFIFRCCFCCCQYIVGMFLLLFLPSMLVHSYTQQVKLHNCEDHFHLDVSYVITFCDVALQLFSRDVDNITYKTLRNKDFKEVTLQVSTNFCNLDRFGSMHLSTHK